MRKEFWTTEYAVATIVLFTIFLFMIPIRFTSDEANYISSWNECYHKIDYMFSAMSAQADSDIVKNFKNAKNNNEREKLMIKLVKPYLRLSYDKKLLKRYHTHYMNGTQTKDGDLYHFKKFYVSENGKIVGVKESSSAGFMMLIDMNGRKGPNIWGRDIFGLEIYSDGEIKALGHDWPIEKMKKDCSKQGLGISCSHFYRIGGQFND